MDQRKSLIWTILVLFHYAVQQAASSSFWFEMKRIKPVCPYPIEMHGPAGHPTCTDALR